MPKGTTELLAEFVEEALAGLGVMDDADELIGYCADENGVEEARKMMERYNVAINFVNDTIDSDITLITEEDFKEWTEQ